MSLQIELQHPLAALHLQECGPLTSSQQKNPVAYTSTLLGDKLYVICRYYCRAWGTGFHWPQKLHCFSVSCSSTHGKVKEAPCKNGTLATYRCRQLVLVGGTEPCSEHTVIQPSIVSDKLWTSEDGGSHWNPSSLPPMPTRRFLPAVLGTAECLIVAGGLTVTRRGKDQHVNAVEVLLTADGQWHTVKPLPPQPHMLKYDAGDPLGAVGCALSNGNLYVLGKPDLFDASVSFCELKTLIDSCTGSSKKTFSWKSLKILPDLQCIASFRGQLIAWNGKSYKPNLTHVLCPLTNTWFQVYCNCDVSGYRLVTNASPYFVAKGVVFKVSAKGTT